MGWIKTKEKKNRNRKKSCSPRDKCEIIVNYLQIRGPVWLPRGIEVNVFAGCCCSRGPSGDGELLAVVVAVVVLEKR